MLLALLVLFLRECSHVSYHVIMGLLLTFFLFIMICSDCCPISAERDLKPKNGKHRTHPALGIALHEAFTCAADVAGFRSPTMQNQTRAVLMILI